ncbi:MAG: peptidylprolyl isomerase [Lachnospiraceae bacterium]|nr:peptidylprolyl isomerase [Lachnospiraceae bacterium]
MAKKVEKKKVWALKAAAAALAASWLAAGCSNSLPSASEVKDGRRYTEAQIMLVVATERNRYSQVYTDQIWQIPVDEAGTTFQDHLLKEVRNFFRELKAMNMLADQQGIKLSGQEKDRLKKLAKDYYQSLTQADLDYIGASQEEIYQLYEEYHRANKLVDELTKDVNLEISDSEAKVIVVQEILAKDPGRAKGIYTRAMAEGVDFEALAQSVSLDPVVEKPIGRGERSKEYEDVAFSLEAGETGPLIRDGDVYYIVKCIKDYDEEATQERKEKLALQRKSQAFRQIYDVFVQENPTDVEGEAWNGPPFSLDEESTTTVFFEWYQEYMG